ncbi:hypothetical protein [Luteimonas sp. e5]
MHDSAISIDTIRSNPELCKLLWNFEVEIGDNLSEDWYTIKGAPSFDSFGADGSGGRFILLTDGRVLFISSEGSAGTIAKDLEEFLDLVSGAPYWGDILHRSNNGDLRCMEQAEALRAMHPRNSEDWPDSMVARFRALAGLGPRRESYASILHENVRSGELDPVVAAPDGTIYESLFGSFQPADRLG